LFNTSETSTLNTTTPAQVTIGEEVTYALKVTVPEGVDISNLQVKDIVPAGMQYKSHTIVTTAATSADYSGANLLTADFNGTVPNPTQSGGASSGDPVIFDFGTIKRHQDGDFTNNTFLINVTATVLDIPATKAFPLPVRIL